MAVVTVDVEGERVGLTVGSVLSLSLEPPLVGVSVSRQAALHELIRRAEEFGVSLLAGGQEDVAQHFARGVPPFAHWHGIALREGKGPPLVADALGWVRCRRVEEHPAGDHTFFVGEAASVEQGRAAPPLIYLGQRYVSL